MVFRLFISCFLFTCCTHPLFSQDDLSLVIKVRDMHTLEHLSKASVLVKKDNQKQAVYKTTDKGKCNFHVNLDHGYHIYIQCKGYVTKYVLIDTRGIPEETKAGGFKLDMDFNLFKERKHFNEELLAVPLGIAKYEEETDAIEFDFSYTEEVVREIDAENERVNKLLQPEFQKWVDKGNTLSQKGNTEKAKKMYRKAFQLIPTDGYILRKLNLYQEEDNSKPTS